MNVLRTDHDLVRIPAGTFVALQRVLATELDAPDAADRVRSVGMEVGAALHDLLRERVSASGGAATGVEELESDEFWSRLDAFFRELGWGGIAHERLHPGVISLSSADWFESATAEGIQPQCHFTVGALGELFRRVAATEVAVMEVGCRSTGGDECRFLVGSPAALDSVFDRMTGGSHYLEAVGALG